MRTTAIVLITSLLAVAAAPASAQEPEAWRKVADSIPLGSKVKVQTIEGRRFSATLLRVDDQAITVKRNARLPEAAIVVRHDAISNLERVTTNGGMSWAKAIGLGLAAGASAIATLVVIALHFD